MAPAGDDGRVAAWEARLQGLLAAGQGAQQAALVQQPVPEAADSHGLVRCLLHRRRKDHVVTLCLEGSGQALLCARKQGSAMLILPAGAEGANAAAPLARLEHNLTGSAYTALSAAGDRELAGVAFSRSQAGPRLVHVALPSSTGGAQAGCGLASLLELARDGKLSNGLLRVDACLLASKLPTWSDKARCHVLDYAGRSGQLQASAKNMQLVAWDPTAPASAPAGSSPVVLLQLGRLSGKADASVDTYALDFQSPLTVAAALAIAVAAIDTKLCFVL